VHSFLQKVEFGFIHDPAESQQKTVVVVARIVESILIGQRYDSTDDGDETMAGLSRVSSGKTIFVVPPTWKQDAMLKNR
jgi:hypothetical protein